MRVLSLRSAGEYDEGTVLGDDTRRFVPESTNGCCIISFISVFVTSETKNAELTPGDQHDFTLDRRLERGREVVRGGVVGVLGGHVVVLSKYSRYMVEKMSERKQKAAPGQMGWRRRSLDRAARRYLICLIPVAFHANRLPHDLK